jgi:aldehyde:ferredoxin oxidoreductase
MDNTCALGIFPAKNCSATGEFTPVEQIGVEALETCNVGRQFCSGCPVGCSQLNLARTEPYEGALAEGPEFETMYSFWGQTGVDRVDSIIAADRLADELGKESLQSLVSPMWQTNWVCRLWLMCMENL